MKRFRSPLAGLIIVLLSLATAYGAISLAGTKTGIALASLAALGPVAAWSFIFAPLIFPFGVFVLLVPFDNLLGFSSFGTITKIAGIASAFSLLLYLIRTRRFVTPDISTFYWALFGGWAVASMLWAIDPMGTVGHLATFLELLTLYVCIALMPISPRVLSILTNAVIASGVLAAAYGAYIFHSGLDVSRNQRLFLSNDQAIIDPNHFAASLIVPIALALVYLVTEKTWTRRVLYAIALCILSLGVGVAASRGSLLAIAAVLGFLIVRSRARISIAVITAIGAGVAFAINANVLARFANAESSGGAGRADIWRVGLAAFRESPIIGQGFGNFPFAYDRAFISVSEHYFTKWHRVAHDVLISTAVELGVFGVILLVMALVTQFKSLRSISRDNPLFDLRTAIESSIVGIAVASLFLDTLTTKYFWLVPILAALARNASFVQQGESREENLPPVLQARPAQR